jgi:ADP-heptose:LPS heptosyltransferase
MQENIEIIMVGTKGNKEKDKYTYGFEYIDLRGKTSIEDIIELANQEQIKYFIGFDNFIMHVFSVLQKPSFVVYRGRIGKHKHEMIRKSHLSLHATDNFVSTL